MTPPAHLGDQPQFVPTGFSSTIHKERYALTPDETWENTCRRVAKQMALAETPEKMVYYEEMFFRILFSNQVVPGGRILYNSGRNKPQLLNCFVLSSQLDSKEGWANIAREMIVTSMTGGGCGIDFSDVRPNGSGITGQKGVCPGPVSLMELVDNCAEPVRNGGERRVALMFSLDLHHPDIEEFLSKKLELGKLTHANVSVRSKRTGEFIKAVRNDEMFELSWKGRFKNHISARALWNTIVKNAYNSAEPGFLNWEFVQSENNIWYVAELVTTNPCGEIALEEYGSCDLAHLVLTRFVKDGRVMWNELEDVIRLGVRFLDNVLTVNTFPMEEMRINAHKYRRIGLGITGLADMLALLGIRYGSPEAIKFIDRLMTFISKNAYEASVMLAVEKGAFPACVPEKHIESGYMKRMPKKIRSMVLEHGIRNCAVLTVAPTGTVSILSDNCSSGGEPMFAAAYERRYWKGDKREVELVFHPLFAKFMAEGRDVSHFVGAHDLTVREHMEVQKVIQRHVDNAVSKTINIPEDYPEEELSELWLEYLPYLKGTTFYRENTRGYVDKDGKVHEPPLVALSLEEAKRRFTIGAKVGTEIDCEECQL